MKQQHSALTRSTQLHAQRLADTPGRDLLADSVPGESRRILWIDGVGGFLLIDRDEVVVGQAVSGSSVDVGIVGDLSRQACAIRRSAGDYLLQPLQQSAIKMDGVNVERPQLLSNQTLIQIGNRVKLRFRKPSALSATARLDLVSLNHFKPHVDGILLLADSCILGPSQASHIVCPHWKSDLLLFRHAGQWLFRTLDEIEVDGELSTGQIPLRGGMRLRGENFSLSVE